MEYKKEIPISVKGLSITHEGRVANCPHCNKFITENDNKKRCPDCGQAIVWSRQNAYYKNETVNKYSELVSLIYAKRNECNKRLENIVNNISDEEDEMNCSIIKAKIEMTDTFLAMIERPRKNYK